MKKLFTLIALGMSLCSYAQTTSTVLCEENFDTQPYKCGPTFSNHFDFQEQNNSGEVQVSFQNSFLPIFGGSTLYYSNNNLSNYDNIEVEMTLKLESNFFMYSYGYVTTISGSLFFPSITMDLDYTDSKTNKRFNGYASSDSFYPIFVRDFITINGLQYYNYTTQVLSLRFSKPSSNRLDLFTSNYFISAFYTSGDFTFTPTSDENQIKQAFCNTTTNPTECMTSVYTSYSSYIGLPQIIFTYDNFKVTGFKNIITGAEQGEEGNGKVLVEAYNLLGKKIENLDTYEGFAIKIYSDGSRVKELVGRK